MTTASMTDISFLHPHWSDLEGVYAGFSCRQGGLSEGDYASLNLAQHVGDDEAVVANNRQLLRSVLPGRPALQWLDQVHGNEVLELTKAGPVQTADAAISRVPGVACCVMTADCLPVFIASNSQAEVALVHGGWRGLVGGILSQTLKKLNTPAAQLRVWLGPAIGPCHFEVGAEVRQAFLESAEGENLAACFSPAEQAGKYMADLYAIARLQLTHLGVQDISGGEHCSYCDRQQFYSYRRDGRTGRNLSLIYLRE